MHNITSKDFAHKKENCSKARLMTFEEIWTVYNTREAVSVVIYTFNMYEECLFDIYIVYIE